MQAVVNEDTDGDRAALKREIKRLQEEVVALKRSGCGGGGGSGGLDAAGSATPARLQAAADAMLAHASPSVGQEVRRGASHMRTGLTCMLLWRRCMCFY